MAPIGYWGHPTSTLDWCEENYEMTRYVAEFWNTISNLALLIPPVCGGWISWNRGLEFRYVLCYVCLFIVGIGSWCFHMTLLYEMQLLDELPMVWGTLAIIYSVYEVHSSSNKINKILIMELFIYGIIVSAVYLAIRQPIFHQVAYGLLVMITVVFDIRLAFTGKSEVWIFIVATISYSVAFCFWNIDNVFCSELNIARKILPFFLRPFTQLHGWWHCLAGYGTYLQILYFCQARMIYRKEPCKIKIMWPFLFPYLGPKKQTMQ